MIASSQSNPQSRIVLQAKNLWKSYDHGAIAVLKGVDFEAVEGQAVALCGLRAAAKARSSISSAVSMSR